MLIDRYCNGTSFFVALSIFFQISNPRIKFLKNFQICTPNCWIRTMRSSVRWWLLCWTNRPSSTTTKWQNCRWDCSTLRASASRIRKSDRPSSRRFIRQVRKKKPDKFQLRIDWNHSFSWFKVRLHSFFLYHLAFKRIPIRLISLV